MNIKSQPPTLTHVDGFRVAGPSVRTQNQDEFHPETARLPHLWQQFYTSGLTGAVFGVYSDYASDANGLYTVTAGVATDAAQAPFTTVSIQSGNYLVFKSQGPMPAAVLDAWKRVWDYFSADCPHQRTFSSDFEAYTGADEVAVYIGVR